MRFCMKKMVNLEYIHSTWLTQTAQASHYSLKQFENGARDADFVAKSVNFSYLMMI